MTEEKDIIEYDRDPDEVFVENARVVRTLIEGTTDALRQAIIIASDIEGISEKKTLPDGTIVIALDGDISQKEMFEEVGKFAIREVAIQSKTNYQEWFSHGHKIEELIIMAKRMKNETILNILFSFKIFRTQMENHLSAGGKPEECTFI